MLCARCHSVLRSEAAAITARLRRYEDRRKVMVSAMFGGPSPVDDSPAVDVDVYQSLLKGRADIAPE